MRLGPGVAAPLRRAEIERLKELATAAGFKSVAIYAAEKLRELVLGAGRHGGPGEPVTGFDSPHETANGIQGAVAVDAPSRNGRHEAAIPPPASSPHSPARRSWAQLAETERVDLAKAWVVKVPLPPAFKEYTREQKVEWMDGNWPLEPKEDIEW